MAMILRILFIALCFTSVNAAGFTPAAPERLAEAQAAIEAFDAELERIRSLPPAEQRSAEAALGQRFDALIKDCRDTRHLNKALFLKANWLLVYRNGDDCLETLEALYRQEYSAFKQAARLTHARLLLAQGDIPAARQMAERLVTTIPEFAGILDIIALHERIGSLAPASSGSSLLAGSDDPRDRDEPWVLCWFGRLGDPEQRYQALRWAREFSEESAYHEQIALVIVCRDASPIFALQHFQSDFTELQSVANLIWNQGSRDQEPIDVAWNLPSGSHCVLLDPKRTILAVDPSHNSIRALVGLDPKQAPRSSGQAPGFSRSNWRGRF